MATTTFFSHQCYCHPFQATRRTCQGGSRVACLNLKMFRFAVLSLFMSLSITKLKEIACPCRNLSLFYVLSLLFGPCRLSEFTLGGPQQDHVFENILRTVQTRNLLFLVSGQLPLLASFHRNS